MGLVCKMLAMNKLKKKGLVVLLILFCITFFLITRPSFRVTDEESKQDEGVASLTAADISEMEEDIERLKVAVTEGEETQQVELAEKIATKTSSGFVSQILMTLSRMQPLQVFGQVVDQFGEPLVGARINVLHAPVGLSGPGSGTHKTYTDSNGRFELSGEGQGMTIDSIVHPETTRLIRRFEYENQPGEGYSHRVSFASSYFNDPSRTGQNTDDPFVIKMYRVSSFENVEVAGMTLGQGGVSIVPDGEVTVDKKLQFSCQRGEKPSDDWKIIIRPIGAGGFQMARDEFLSEAPDGGYDIPQIELGAADERRPTNNSVRPLNKRWYYTSDSGGTYGVFSILWAKPFYSRRSCGVFFDVIKYNPEASRSLAVPPKYDRW